MRPRRWPVWIQRLLRHEAALWNAGVGLILTLSLLRYLLGR